MTLIASATKKDRPSFAEATARQASTFEVRHGDKGLDAC
jgi:hypothetical protein